MNNISSKKEINAKKVEIKTAQSEKVKLTKSITEINTKIQDSKNATEKRIKVEEAHIKEKVMKECTKPLEDDVSKLESNLRILEEEKNSKIKEYSFDNIKKKILAESPVDEDTQSLIKEIREEANNTVSERFVDCYFALTEDLEVDEEDFLYALDQLGVVRDNLIYCNDSTLNSYSKKIANFISEIQLNSEEDNKNISTVIGVGVVSCILSFVLYSIYIVILTGMFLHNLRRSYYMKQSLDMLKVVQDNLILMTDALEFRAKSEFKKKQHSLDEDYNLKITELQSQIDVKNSEISKTRQDEIAKFKFDDTSIREDLAVQVKSLEHSITEKESQVKIVENKLEKLQEDLSDLEDAYNKELSNIVERHLNYEDTGDEVFFPKKFLLVADEPFKFFEHANYSNFFLYRDVETMYNFIKLICVQLRSLMRPATFEIQVWDIATVGTAFMSFKNPDINGDTLGFTIHNNTTDIKDSLKALDTLLQKRFQIIRVSYNTIDDYNKDMVTLKSVTETYHIIFVLSPKSLLENEEYQRLLLNGAELGIYFYTFADINFVNESYFSILNNSSYCSNLGNNSLNPSATSAMKEAIINLKENKR